MAIIISNPPYIPTKEIDSLQREVKVFEPRVALDGGSDGLDFYWQIAKNCKKYLKASGVVVVEIGFNQKDLVVDIFAQNNFTLKDCQQDLAALRYHIPPHPSRGSIGISSKHRLLGLLA